MLKLITKQAPCCEKHSRALEFLYRKHKNKPRRITKRNPARFMELVAGLEPATC